MSTISEMLQQAEAAAADVRNTLLHGDDAKKKSWLATITMKPLTVEFHTVTSIND